MSLNYIYSKSLIKQLSILYTESPFAKLNIFKEISNNMYILLKLGVWESIDNKKGFPNN